MAKDIESKNKKVTNKGDLVSSVATLSGLSKADAMRALDGMFDSIKKGLKDGDDVRIQGLGIFSVKEREAGIGRNPRTGEPLKIKAAKLPKFRAGKTLKDAIA